MSHYFINDENVKSKEYIVTFTLNSQTISLYSDNGIFSKSKIDKGTYFLIKELSKENIAGKVLDFGAGIGVIGISLNLIFKELELTYCEINSRAIEIIKKNLKNYGLNGDVVETISEVEDKFDIVTLNPPISCGKEAIYHIYKDIYKALKNDGKFYIVIRKDKGMNSHKEFLETLFNKVEILGHEKGYFILKMEKGAN